MKITKRLSISGASEEAISGLETKNGFTLPDDYRRFMSEFNGGHPEPSSFAFTTPNGKIDSSVRFFLTLDDQEENYTIQEFLDCYTDRIPVKLLPIACDSFGNLILLDGGARSMGVVYFWDHERESMDEPTWDNIAIVAPSFTDFLNSLK